MKRRQNRNSGPAGDGRAISSRRLLVLLGVGLIGLATGAWLTHNFHRTRAPHFSAVAGAAAGLEGNAGPWGKLRGVEVELQPPEKSSPGSCRTNLPKWCFHADSLEEVHRLLGGYGCTETQAAALIQTMGGQPRDLMLAPTLDVIWGLLPEVRSRVYRHLAECPKNQDQMFAARRQPEDFARRLAAAPFSSAAKGLISYLVYTNDGYTYFADEPALFSRLKNNEEKVQILDWLLRMKTMILTLHVDHGQDARALAEYWGVGGYLRDVLPILQALAEKPGGGEVDVVNLLPPFAQLRLYSYPRLDELDHDCIWTTLNFFNKTPDEAADLAQMQKLWREQYEHVPPEQARLGDWVLFTNPAGEIVHSAIYVADDILFTKNGNSVKKPWVLMRLGDVRNTFWQTAPVFGRRRHF